MHEDHRTWRIARGRRALGAGAATAGLVAVLLAASAVPTAAAPTSAAVGAPRASGTVDVLYAGSLLAVMQNDLAPAFHRATGYTVSGISGGSTGLANQIKSGAVVGDVFISASPTADEGLVGTANGGWVTKYTEFGVSPLVLGYNPASRFARALTSRPWFDVVDAPGFLLGRTNPKTDPKGVLAADALQGVALSYQLPQLGALVASSSGVFPETSLVGRLQAGQLDAGFFYKVEATAASIRTVPLASTGLAAQYTVAQLNRAPHPAAAKAFVRFLLSAAGRAILKKDGVTAVVPPKVL